MRFDQLNKTIGSKRNSFGLDIEVKRPARPKQDSNAGTSVPDGIPESSNLQQVEAMKPGNSLYRRVIPRGEIGSREYYDPQLPPPQYVDTVPWERDEEKDPDLHGAMEAMRSANRGVEFQTYGKFQPRCAPIPRALQDEAGFGSGTKKVFPTSVRLGADPLMNDDDSESLFINREDYLRKDLYGDNRDGFLHNDDPHPGFQAVQSKIAKQQGVSQERAGAILASRTRGASAAAKKANPRLKRVKG